MTPSSGSRRQKQCASKDSSPKPSTNPSRPRSSLTSKISGANGQALDSCAGVGLASARTEFGSKRVRVICTGTSGTDRIGYLHDLASRAKERGKLLEIFDLREARFQIAHDVGEPVEEETILDMFPRALVLL